VRVLEFSATASLAGSPKVGSPELTCGTGTKRQISSTSVAVSCPLRDPGVYAPFGFTFGQIAG